jgi:hypothetical protein
LREQKLGPSYLTGLKMGPVNMAGVQKPAHPGQHLGLILGPTTLAQGQNQGRGDTVVAATSSLTLRLVGSSEVALRSTRSSSFRSDTDEAA